MLDRTSYVTWFIPSRFKEKLADSLVELLAGSAESLGGDQIAGNIRKFSSRGALLQSIDRALEAGIGRFIKDYMSQDEDLVEAIRADELFWQSEVVQDALSEVGQSARSLAARGAGDGTLPFRDRAAAACQPRAG